MSLTVVESPYSVRTTMDRLIAALNRRGIAVFARVDHSGGARSAGLELADEEVLIFGDPRVGTFLMQSDPEIGYELPLRVLVWDAGGQTRVGYRRPIEVVQNYAVTDQTELLDRMNRLLTDLVAESTTSAAEDGSFGKGD
jgi:beta-galactosidase